MTDGAIAKREDVDSPKRITGPASSAAKCLCRTGLLAEIAPSLRFQESPESEATGRRLTRKGSSSFRIAPVADATPGCHVFRHDPRAGRVRFSEVSAIRIVQLHMTATKGPGVPGSDSSEAPLFVRISLGTAATQGYRSLERFWSESIRARLPCVMSGRGRRSRAQREDALIPGAESSAETDAATTSFEPVTTPS